MNARVLMLMLLSVVVPPLAVFLKGGDGKELVINMILCVLGFLPGVIHALWSVLMPVRLDSVSLEL